MARLSGLEYISSNCSIYLYVGKTICSTMVFSVSILIDNSDILSEINSIISSTFAFSCVISKRSKKLNAASSWPLVNHVIPGASISASTTRSFLGFFISFNEDHALTNANKDNVRPTPPLYEWKAITGTPGSSFSISAS